MSKNNQATIMSFYDYMIKNHLGEDNPAGDLAFDLSRTADTFPKDSAEKRVIQEYLIRHASPEVLRVFRECWKEYLSSKNP